MLRATWSASADRSGVPAGSRPSHGVAWCRAAGRGSCVRSWPLARPRATRSRKNPSQPAPSGGAHLQPKDLPVAVTVDAGGDQGLHRHDPPALTDLQHERVGREERERSRLGQGAGAQLLDVRVQLGGHLRDLRPRSPWHCVQGGTPRSVIQALDEPVHPARRHHRGQRPLRALTALQQPLREVGPGPQLRHRHVERAGTGGGTALHGVLWGAKSRCRCPLRRSARSRLTVP